MNAPPEDVPFGDVADLNGSAQAESAPVVRRPMIPTTRPMPHSQDAEEGLVSCCFSDDPAIIAKAVESGITGGSFYDPRYAAVFNRLVDLEKRQLSRAPDVVAEELKKSGEFEGVGGYPFITQVSAAAATTARGSYFIEEVKRNSLLREVIRNAVGAIEDAHAGNADAVELTARLKEAMVALSERATSSKSLKTTCFSREFSSEIEMVEPVPRFLINGNAVCTAGNLTTITSQSKTGKSSLTGAQIAAAICADNGTTDRDTLGFTATKPTGVLLHIDTEQSLFDHNRGMKNNLRRAGVTDKPSWLRSFALTGFTADELKACLVVLMEHFSPNGIFAVVIDGSADMVKDVNDAVESNAFVAQLQSLAIKHDCPIIGVVHENPGQDIGKMRGHLGSQLERKAESNLRLKKTDGITTVFSDKMRKAPILEKDGPRFSWDTKTGMHMSLVPSGVSRDSAKKDSLILEVEALFQAAKKDSMTWNDLVLAIAAQNGIQRSSATKRFDELRKLGVVKKDLVGHWRL